MTFKITPRFSEDARGADEVEWQRFLRRLELLGYLRLLLHYDDGSVLMSTPEGVSRDDLKKAGGE